MMSFEGVKIPSTPDDYVLLEVNTFKGELSFEYMDKLGQWYRYFYISNLNPKWGKKYVHHELPTYARPVPAKK